MRTLFGGTLVPQPLVTFDGNVMLVAGQVARGK